MPTRSEKGRPQPAGAAEGTPRKLSARERKLSGEAMVRVSKATRELLEQLAKDPAGRIYGRERWMGRERDAVLYDLLFFCVHGDPAVYRRSTVYEGSPVNAGAGGAALERPYTPTSAGAGVNDERTPAPRASRKPRGRT